MIPYGQFDPRALGNLLDYLTLEIRKALGERRLLEDNWKRWLQQYRATPWQTAKDFPFTGASNLVVPVTATDVETTWARFLGLLFGPDNLWSMRPLRPDMVDFAPRLQEFVQWAQNNDIPKLYENVSDAIFDTILLGTGILKTRYERRMQRVYEWRETPQGPYEAHPLIWLKDNPMVGRVAPDDFLVPSSTYEIEDARWVAERLSLTWQQLLERVNAGLYTAIPLTANSRTGVSPLGPLMEHWARSRGSRVQEHRAWLDTVIPGMGDKFEIWEVWVKWDIQNRGEQRALVCGIHLDTNSYLRLDWNPFFNQEPPYDPARFIRVPGRFWGMGLGEVLDQTQEEVTTTRNQRIDNRTIANSVMLVAPNDGSVKQEEKIYPGRIWLTPDPQLIRPLNMGQKYDSTIEDETMALNYAARRTGVNDYTLGQNDPSIGYATGATNLAMMREGAKRIDQSLREIRKMLTGCGRKIVELYQQYAQGPKPFLALGPEEGQIVQQILQFPTDLIRFGIAIDVTATSATLNREVEIRTNTLLYQQSTEFAGQLFQAMTLFLNPQLPPPLKMLLLQAMEGGSILMRRIVDAYGIQDANRIVPDVRSILGGPSSNVLGADNPLAALGLVAGGGGVGGGPSAAPGVSNLLGGAPGALPAGAVPSQQPNGNGGGIPFTRGGTGAY